MKLEKIISWWNTANFWNSDPCQESDSLDRESVLAVKNQLWITYISLSCEINMEHSAFQMQYQVVYKGKYCISALRSFKSVLVKVQQTF